MEPKLCVSEEHGLVDGNSDSHIFQIKDFDAQDEAQRKELLPLFWEFWIKVQREDQSLPVRYNLFGFTYEVPEIEATLYRFVYKENCRIKVAYQDDVVVGFMLYNLVFDSILVIRHMYTMVSGLGKWLVECVDNVKKVIFQTRKENPPERCLQLTEKFRKKITETDKIITWEMDWGNNGKY